MTDAGIWSRNNEKNILQARDALIRLHLSNGFSVIVDDTNFSSKHQVQLEKIAEEYDAKLIVKSFLDVPLKDCISRDLKRDKSVGERAITSMYNTYLKPKVKQIKQDPDNPDAIQFDLDGTLALFGDANPYDRDCSYDTVNWPVYDELISYQKKGYKIIILSGRKGEYLEKTGEWLKKNGIKPDLFIMRSIGDMRKDYVVKEEMFRKYVLPAYNVKIVFDDRNQVVDLWRSLGLTCFQVAAGDF